jgi:uncharacterized membrane protein YozB (DUF420 family)
LQSSDPEILKSANSTFTSVDLLGVLFALWGILTMLIGASTLALGIAAAALVSSASGGGFGAGLTAAAFTTLAVLALVWGGVHLLVGTVLRRRRQWSRHAALMLGTVDLLLLPYGTALGVYSLWSLLREDAKRLFQG